MAQKQTIAHTITKLNSFWEKQFNSTPPVASYLREQYNRSWIRFHCLPGGKRIPESGRELQQCLERYAEIIGGLVAEGSPLLLIQPTYSQDQRAQLLDDSSFWSTVAMHLLEGDEYPNYWHFFVRELKWGRTRLDRLFKQIAQDKVENVILLFLNEKVAYHPYDGGIDVFTHERAKLRLLSDRYHQWLS